MKTKIAIFDLDFTLINSNSTFDFIYFYIKSKKSYKKLIKALFFLFFEKLGVLTEHFHRKKKPLFLGFLSGEQSSEINRMAEKYFLDRGKKILNRDLLAEIRKLKESGFLMVLASSSLNPVVEVFARKLNFDDFFASTLRFEGSICRGTMGDILGKKENLFDYLQEKGIDIDFELSYFFSDNKEDMKIFEKIKNSFAVVSDPVVAKFWEARGIKTFHINPVTSINRNIFFLPLSYYWISRASKGVRHMLVHYIGFPILVLILFGNGISVFNISLFFLAYCSYTSLYEIGYFVNDTVAIKKERRPNLREGALELGDFKYFVIARIFFFLLSCLLLVFLEINIFTFIVGTAIFLIVFSFHNKLTGKIKLLTFSILKLSHYVTPLLIFSPSIYFPAIILFFVLQLPEEILFYGKRKYKEENPTLREVKNIVIFPTFIILLFLFIALLFGFYNFIYGFFFVALYIFIYKFISYLRKVV